MGIVSAAPKTTIWKKIASKGGKAVAVFCDHSNDKEVVELFERIAKDENNRLDVLVNNAYSGSAAVGRNEGKKFYECDLSFWDEINNVGLRNVYICSVLAARLMVPRQKGLIVNISSAAGIRYFFNVPYGVGKAAVDRLSADMAEELKNHRVTVVSLWPGTVKTEQTYEWLRSGKLSKLTKLPQAQLERMVANGESPEFVGRAIMCLAYDNGVFRKTGHILLTADLCDEYMFIDDDVGKAAVDRLSADMAEELKNHRVTVVSLWPGTVKTEQTYEWLRSGKLSKLTKLPQAQLERMVANGESPEFVGRAIMCLAYDNGVFRKTGHILLTADLCDEYMFIDDDGGSPDYRFFFFFEFRILAIELRK
ncbi:unnamed protein product [Gongylonema pulchrum]|uniref:Dehydrogenase/reductase SDR family member 1 n=1 Tax=Gongylonema pulchrum TaxID=637853 RepID=A0A183EAP8_9BILA|nr:unnamed protein product [Gongylonema pulchrum]